MLCVGCGQSVAPAGPSPAGSGIPSSQSQPAETPFKGDERASMKLIPQPPPERSMQPQTFDELIAELKAALERARELADAEGRRADLLQQALAEAFRRLAAHRTSLVASGREPRADHRKG
jgi:hypothetical protein